MVRRVFRSRFNACHSVQLTDGHEPMHSHDWKVQIELDVTDGSDGVSVAIDGILGSLDGNVLNDLKPFKTTGASAECVARFLHAELLRRLAGCAQTVVVKVEEEPGCFAAYFEE